MSSFESARTDPTKPGDNSKLRGYFIRGIEANDALDNIVLGSPRDSLNEARVQVELCEPAEG